MTDDTLTARALEHARRADEADALRAAELAEQHRARLLGQADQLARRVLPEAFAAELSWELVVDDESTGQPVEVPMAPLGTHAGIPVLLAYRPRQGDLPERLVPAAPCPTDGCPAFVPVAGAPYLEHFAGADGLADLGRYLSRLEARGLADCAVCVEPDDEPATPEDTAADHAAAIEQAVDRLFGVDALVKLDRAAAADPVAAAVLYLAGRIDVALPHLHTIAQALTHEESTP